MHRDPSKIDLRWWTVARIRSIRDPAKGLTLEHATGVSGPGLTEPRSTGVPAVLKRILQLKNIGVEERDGAVLIPRRVDRDSLEAYVMHDLLEPTRVLPHLVVVSRPDVQDVVDVEHLASLLATQVVVVRLALNNDTLFRRALKARGFSEELGLIGPGGARLYHPNIQEKRDPKHHALWPLVGLKRFASLPPRAVADRFAPMVASRVVWRALPPNFFSSISDWDRRERRSVISKFLEDSANRERAAKRSQVEQDATIQELRRHLDASECERALMEQRRDHLEGQLRAMRVEKEEFEELLRIAETENFELARTRDHALQEKHNLSATLASIRQGKEQDYAVSYEDRDSLANAVWPTNLESALQFIEILYRDRVIVLPSAYASAREAETFRHPERAFEHMRTLVTNYWSAHRTGGDAAAREAFGRDAYAALESESVMARARARQLRTFDYAGTPYTMWRHLKIGIKDSSTETWRLHFEVDTKSCRILIGHCGKHLDHS